MQLINFKKLNEFKLKLLRTKKNFYVFEVIFKMQNIEKINFFSFKSAFFIEHNLHVTYFLVNHSMGTTKSH